MLLFFVWDTLWLQPLQGAAQRIRNQTFQMRTETDVLRQQIQALNSDETREKQEQLDQDIQTAEATKQRHASTIENHYAQMIKSDEIVALLRAMLKKTEGVRLISLEGVEPDVIQLDTEVDEEGSVLYKHGIHMIVEGAFSQILRFLSALEGAGWEMHWESMEYEVQDYPLATAELQLRTLSLDAQWLGV